MFPHTDSHASAHLRITERNERDKEADRANPTKQPAPTTHRHLQPSYEPTEPYPATNPFSYPELSQVPTRYSRPLRIHAAPPPIRPSTGWNMKRQHLSNRIPTRWDELTVAEAR
ncbi:DUF4113 domain-containing protein [Bifidobacterium fermentum]|uniref:DUF4113 domain-containing protein n=1 Tax=Bifidobacterium TaxID=1678 RepID=UPI001303ACBF